MITVRLRHAIIQHVDRDGQAKLAEVFIREDLTLQMRTPTSFEVKEACFFKCECFCYVLASCIIILSALVPGHYNLLIRLGGQYLNVDFIKFVTSVKDPLYIQ